MGDPRVPIQIEIQPTQAAYEKRLMTWALSQFTAAGPKISVNQLAKLGRVTRRVIYRNLDQIEAHLRTVNPFEPSNSKLSTYVRSALVDKEQGRDPSEPGSALRAAIARADKFRRPTQARNQKKPSVGGNINAMAET